MLKKLQQKWKVGSLQLVLILSTFAIGGSLTGYAARKIMPVLAIGQVWLWIFVYILLVTLLWPLSVILVSIPFGQFSFFNTYIHRIGKRMGVLRSVSQPSLTNIAIFASGKGSNAQRIVEHFKNNPAVKVVLIVSNNPQAGVLNIAAHEKISSLLIEKEKFFRGDAYIKELKENNIDFIVLAGFLWKIPVSLINAYKKKIINIHPALLPKFGGKGMFGQAVHEAVIAAKEKEGGITIHYVDEIYDHGETIFQAKCPVLENDSPETLANRIHDLEHEHYPKVIEKLLVK